MRWLICFERKTAYPQSTKRILFPHLVVFPKMGQRGIDIFICLVITHWSILGALSQLSWPQRAALRCYKCFSFECKPENDCASVERFIQQSLKLFYQVEGPELAKCPVPSDEVGWESLKVDPSNIIPCPGPCTIGRFQVTSGSDRGGGNAVEFGTVLGCPRPQLLRAILYPQKPIDGNRERATCRFDNVTSAQFGPTWGFRAEMAMEHCGRLGDICNTKNYCFATSRSIIVPFGTDPEHSSISGFVFWVIIACVIIGLLVCVLTFAGIKYG